MRCGEPQYIKSCTIRVKLQVEFIQAIDTMKHALRPTTTTIEEADAYLSVAGKETRLFSRVKRATTEKRK